MLACRSEPCGSWLADCCWCLSGWHEEGKGGLTGQRSVGAQEGEALGVRRGHAVVVLPSRALRPLLPEEALQQLGQEGVADHAYGEPHGLLVAQSRQGNGARDDRNPLALHAHTAQAHSQGRRKLGRSVGPTGKKTFGQCLTVLLVPNSMSDSWVRRSATHTIIQEVHPLGGPPMPRQRLPCR